MYLNFMILVTGHAVNMTWYVRTLQITVHGRGAVGSCRGSWEQMWGGGLITHFVLICRQCTRTNLTLLVVAYIASIRACIFVVLVSLLNEATGFFPVSRWYWTTQRCLSSKYLKFHPFTLSCSSWGGTPKCHSSLDPISPSSLLAGLWWLILHLLWKTDICDWYWYWFLLNV